MSKENKNNFPSAGRGSGVPHGTTTSTIQQPVHQQQGDDKHPADSGQKDRSGQPASLVPRSTEGENKPPPADRGNAPPPTKSATTQKTGHQQQVVIMSGENQGDPDLQTSVKKRQAPGQPNQTPRQEPKRESAQEEAGSPASAVLIPTGNKNNLPSAGRGRGLQLFSSTTKQPALQQQENYNKHLSASGQMDSSGQPASAFPLSTGGLSMSPPAGRDKDLPLTLSIGNADHQQQVAVTASAIQGGGSVKFSQINPPQRPPPRPPLPQLERSDGPTDPVKQHQQATKERSTNPKVVIMSGENPGDPDLHTSGKKRQAPGQPNQSPWQKSAQEERESEIHNPQQHEDGTDEDDTEEERQDYPSLDPESLKSVDLPYVWETVRFAVKKLSMDAVEMKVSKVIQPCLVQFAMTNRNFVNTFTAKLQSKHSIKATLSQTAVISIEVMKDMPVLELEKHAHTSFESLITKLFTVKFISAASHDGVLALESLRSNPPPQITSNLVEIYQDKLRKTLFIVGERDDVDDTIKKLGISTEFDSNIVEVTDDFKQYLRQLDYDKYFAENDVTLIFVEGLNKIELKATTKEKLIWANNILKKYSRKTLDVDKDAVDLFEKDQAYTHLQKLMQKEECRCYVSVCDKKVCLQAMDKESVLRGEQIVISSCKSVTVSLVVLEKVLSRFESKHQGKCIVHQKGGKAKITYTTDLDKDMTSLIAEASIETVQYSCSKAMAEFLHTHGKTLVEKLATKHHVEFFVSCESRFIQVKGPVSAIMDAKAELYKTVHEKNVIVSLNDWKELQLEVNRKIVDQLANKHQACWSTTDVCDPRRKKKKLTGAAYKRCWANTAGQGRITMVEGAVTEMNVDVLIHPVNTSMFPCVSDDIATAAGCQEKMQQLAIQEHGKYALGRCIISPDTGQLACRLLAHLVTNEVSKKSHCTDEQFMKAVCYILKHADSLMLTSIGIPLDFFIQLDVTKLIKHIGMFFKEHPETTIQEIFLIHARETRDKVYLKDLEDGMQLMHYNEVNLTDYSSSHAGKEATEKKILQTDVHSGDILKFQVHCLVVLVAEDLDLTTGIVSNEVQKTEGKQIQSVLREKYPDGIGAGQIAFIEVHNMKCQYVIFSALPRWQGMEMLQGLKHLVENCLIKAEELGCSSIAFPALGTGNLKYPYRDVAATMFDVAEQFSAVNLTHIWFVIYGNDKAMKAFTGEHVRRRKYGLHPNNFPITGSEYPILQSQLTNTCSLQELVWQKELNIKVVCQSNVKDSASYAVEVVLVSPTTGVSAKLKNCATIPLTLKDRLEVHLDGKSEYDFKCAVHHCFDVCRTERATEIIFNCSLETSLSISKQIEILTTMLAKLDNQYIHLKTVIVAVHDEMEFSSAVDCLLTRDKTQEMTTEPKTIWKLPNLDWLPIWGQNGDSKVKWELETAGQLRKDDFELQVVATNDAELNGLVQELQEAINKIRRGQESDKFDIETETSNEIDSVFEEVTAEVNEGIVDYKNKTGELQTWLKQLENVFNMNVYDTDRNGLVIHGSLTDISRIETYLRENFPDDPRTISVTTETDSKDRVKEVSIVEPMTSQRYEAMHRFCISEVKNLTGFTTRIHFDKNAGALKFICEQQDEDNARKALKQCLEKLTDIQLDEITDLSPIEANKAKRVTEEVSKQFSDVHCSFIVECSRIEIAGGSKHVGDAKHKILIGLERLKPTDRHRKRSSCKNDGEMQLVEEYFAKDSFKNEQSEFVLNNGIRIKVYVGNILTVAADGIVSSADKRLTNRYGVAAAIAGAAGQEYKTKCKENIRKCGDLKSLECRETQAGNLKAKHVLHLCVPTTHGNAISQQDLLQLQKAMVNALTKAEHLKLSVVAFPCVCTGRVAQWDVKLCAEQYYRALEEFAKKGRNVSEVHFIDQNHSTVRTVQQCFSGLFSSVMTARKLPDTERRKTQTSFSQHESKFCVGSKAGYVTVHVAMGDVTAVSVDAVVSPEDTKATGKGYIASTLLELGGVSYKAEHSALKNKNLTVKDVEDTNVHGDLSCKKVLHVITPRWNKHYIQHNQDFEHDLRNTMANILVKATRLRLKTIALPLLGSSDDETTRQTPLETCCRAIIDGLLDFTSQTTTSIQNIHFLNKEESVCRVYVDILRAKLPAEATV